MPSTAPRGEVTVPVPGRRLARVTDVSDTSESSETSKTAETTDTPQTPQTPEAIAPSPHGGMGAVLIDGGVTFRVWAPNAASVGLTGELVGWDQARTVRMARDDEGRAQTWSAHVPGATAGQEYQLLIETGGGTDYRVDPYARQMTSSVGNPVIYDPGAFDWGDDEFQMPPWDEIVIYEMHIGTFSRDGDGVGTFAERSTGSTISSSSTSRRSR